MVRAAKSYGSKRLPRIKEPSLKSITFMHRLRELAVVACCALGLTVAGVGIAHASCTVTWNAGVRYVTGSTGNDVCTGSGVGEVMQALAGDDDFFGQGGVDDIAGNAGDDDLKGETGNDYVHDGQGGDTDRLCGGQDRDTVSVTDGDTNDKAHAGTVTGDDAFGDSASELPASCPI